MKSQGRSWTVRLRQSLLTAALGVPLAAAIATAPPFAAEPRAAAAITNMLGPASPIMAGSTPVMLNRSGNTVAYPTAWACGDTASYTVALENPDGSGRFQAASRDLGSLHQTVSITGFASGAPQQFNINETRGGVTAHSSNVALVDQNADGVFDAATFSGQYNVTVSFAVTGNAISIPWSQASAIGIDTSTSCAGALPQVWFPLADTNGDGRGDKIVFDLDGNGVPDVDFFSSPPLDAPAVPSMGPIGRLLLLLVLGASGSWFISRRRDNIAGTPA